MLSFPGINLEPGDVLRIDTSTKTVTLNGENAYHKLAKGASFFMLSSSENEIEFTGNGSAKIKVLHRERYI